MISEGATEEVLRHQPADLLEFALQHLCQSRLDLDVYLASPASGHSALCPISEAGPALSSWCVAVFCGGFDRGILFLFFVFVAVEESGTWGTAT